MATENLAAEKAVEGLAEEIKAAEGIANVAQESPFQSKHLEEQDVGEKLKEDGLGIVEASAAGSEERSGNEKIDAGAENVKEKEKEEEEDVHNSNSENFASDTAEKGEITTQEYDTLAVEPVVEVHEELMSHPDDTDIPEPPKEEIEKSAEDSEEPLVEVSESEAAKELEISSAVRKEEKPTEDIPNISVSETDRKSELPISATITESTMDSITSPDDGGSAEISEVENSFTGEREVKCESSREEPPVVDSSEVEETSDKLPEVVISENSVVVPAEASPLNELKELGEGTVTSPEVPDVIEKKTDSNQSASRVVEESVMEENVSAITESIPVTKTTEGITKPDDEVEEVMPAKAAEVEEQTLSGTLQTNNAAEIAQASSEGSLGVETSEEKEDETSEAVIKTSESVDAATGASQVEGEKPFGGVEVAEEKNEGMENGDKIVEGGEYTSEFVDAANEFPQVEGVKASAEAEENNDRMKSENTSLVETSRNLAAEEGKVTSESMATTTEFSQVEGEKASEGGEVAEENNETVEEQTASGTLQTDNAAEFAQVSSEGSAGVEKFEEENDETSEAVIEPPEFMDAATEFPQVEGVKASAEAEVAEENNIDRMEGENRSLVETSRNLAAEEGKVASESMYTTTEFSQVEGEKASGGGEVAEEKNETVEEETSSGTLQTDNAAEFAQVSSEGSAGVEKFEEEKDETSEAVIEHPEFVDAATQFSQVEGVKASAEAEVAEENKDRMEGENTSLVETSRNLAAEEGKVTSESMDTTEFSQVEGEKALGGGGVAEEKNETVEEQTSSGTLQTDNDAEFAQVSSEGSAGVEKFEEEKDETSEAVIEPPESVDAATEVSQVEGVKASAEAEVAEENNDRLEGENMNLVDTSRNLAVEEGKATSKSVDAAAEVSEVEGEKAYGGGEGERASGGGEVAEVKNVEGDKTTLVETTRDIDVYGLKDTDTTAVEIEDDAHKKEGNEKADEQNPIESAKDGGDASTELPEKSSHRHRFFSKVKQSIVKVKKAIVGKSPNSKTMTAEGNDDI